MRVFQVKASLWVALSLFLVLFPGPNLAREGGKVELQLSQAVVSSLLTEALRGLDPSIRAQVSFKAGDSQSSDGKAVLIYKVFLSVPDLRLDSMEGIASESDLGPLKKALEDLRSSLSSRGLSEVSFEIGTKMSLDGDGDKISTNIKLYPRTLRVHAKSNDDGKLDILINEILRPLLLDRYLEHILEGIERKYLRELKIGQLFELKATNLAKDHLIKVQIDLGAVNQLNALDFVDFSTTSRNLILKGRTRLPSGEMQ